MITVSLFGALALYLIGRAGDIAARVHRDRDPWSQQQ